MVCSRRSFLTVTGALALTGLSAQIRAQSAQTGAQYSDKTAADEWIKKWMSSPQAASGGLRLGRFADRIYFLTEEIGWAPNPGQESQKPVRVPVGFVTDFASIPRIFWSLLPPDGLYTFPAIIHDYLYWEQPVNRNEADLILRYGMQDFKVSEVTIGAIYNAVRLGGEIAWRDNAALKAAGEKRCLKLYPTDPTVRWSDWKTKSGVFC